jgi:hypothetical protein
MVWVEDFGRGRLKALLMLIAALTLIVAVGGSSAHAGSSGDTASAAKKKKCKKGKKASVAKKKKCKKSKGSKPAPVVTPPAPPPSGPAVERAKLTWTATGGTAIADLNLYGFLATNSFTGGGSGLTAGTLSGSGTYDDQANGHEEINDSANPSTAKVTYVICAYNVPEDVTATWNLHIVYSNGTTDDKDGAFTESGFAGDYQDPAGSVDIEAANFCSG